ncbi:MAG TPA: acetyl-CoA C-acyltransferase, partial [Acidimicrobiia bacterium]|nr:acetyl-CoA C-acyltransferase [Acidimicrobiia bacterium]
MSEAVVLSAVRTAIADAYKGTLANVSIHDLAKPVVVEALKRSGVEADDVDDLVLGEVLHGGGCVARYVAVDLGLPDDTPGLALNRQCATGMSAVDVAAAEIMAGMNRVAIAGGVAS